jgi:hypothetical protein
MKKEATLSKWGNVSGERTRLIHGWTQAPHFVYYVANYGRDLGSLQLQGTNENPRWPQVRTRSLDKWISLAKMRQYLLTSTTLWLGWVPGSFSSAIVCSCAIIHITGLRISEPHCLCQPKAPSAFMSSITLFLSVNLTLCYALELNNWSFRK